jgi:hypothetical protein
MQTFRYSRSLLHRHGFLYRGHECTQAAGTRRLTAADTATAVPDAVAAAGWPAEHGRLEAGPVQPGMRSEMSWASLMADESRLGQAYRCLEEGLDADATAGKCDIGHPSFIWNYRRVIRALADGDLPSAPAVALAAARKIRSIPKMPLLTGAARTYLEANLEELERRANDADRREEEVQRAQVQTQQAEARNKTGIRAPVAPTRALAWAPPRKVLALTVAVHARGKRIIRFWADPGTDPCQGSGPDGRGVRGAGQDLPGRGSCAGLRT